MVERRTVLSANVTSIVVSTGCGRSSLHNTYYKETRTLIWITPATIPKIVDYEGNLLASYKHSTVVQQRLCPSCQTRLKAWLTSKNNAQQYFFSSKGMKIACTIRWTSTFEYLARKPNCSGGSESSDKRRPSFRWNNFLKNFFLNKEEPDRLKKFEITASFAWFM